MSLESFWWNTSYCPRGFYLVNLINNSSAEAYWMLWLVGYDVACLLLLLGIKKLHLINNHCYYYAFSAVLISQQFQLLLCPCLLWSYFSPQKFARLLILFPMVFPHSVFLSFILSWYFGSRSNYEQCTKPNQELLIWPSDHFVYEFGIVADLKLNFTVDGRGM